MLLYTPHTSLPDERDRFLEGPRSPLPISDPFTNVSPFKAGLDCLRNRDGRERLLSEFREKALSGPSAGARSVVCTLVIIKGAVGGVSGRGNWMEMVGGATGGGVIGCYLLCRAGGHMKIKV